MPWVSGEIFSELLSVLQRMDRKLSLLLRNEEEDMAKIDDDLARLRAQVQQVNDTEDAASALIQGLVQQLKSAQQQPDIGAAVDGIIAGLQQHQQPLAAAVAENTPGGDQPGPGFQPSGQ